MMNSIYELIDKWERSGKVAITTESSHFKLSFEHSSVLKTLCNTYPSLTKEQILRDLLHTSLNELVAKMPYVQGTKIIAFDEDGDPIYEDVGKTPIFLSLADKHHKRIMRL
ncbi:MAG: pilin assembly protein [Pseudomonadales bacterium]